MFTFKLLTMLVAGVLGLLAIRHMMRELDAAKVRVKSTSPRQPRSVTKLRQDPRTGVYYPEN